MKSRAPILVAVLLLLLPFTEALAGTKSGKPQRTVLRMKATAYSLDGLTKSGEPTVEGRTVAADPKVLPIGTVVRVRNAGPYSGVYVVTDTGRAIKGNEIDIHIDNAAEAKKFGERMVSVEVLKMASPDGQNEAR
jgi:3D (Asp-Asp-Asp) domain-containing protein